jgi:hypothetical protein
VIHAPEREISHWTARRWLPFAVALSSILLLAAFLLDALAEAEERSEKLMVELTFRNMRTGLQLAKGEAMLRGRRQDIQSWAGANPVRWLDGPPPGYRGDCGSPAHELAEGEWCFDDTLRELAYRPRHAPHLRLTQSEGEPKQLRWRVIATPAAGETRDVYVEYVTAFTWFLE